MMRSTLACTAALLAIVSLDFQEVSSMRRNKKEVYDDDDDCQQQGTCLHNLYHDLWHGKDLADDMMDAVHAHSSQQDEASWIQRWVASLAEKKRSVDAAHKYFLWGTFDSGTNLFVAMAKLNFPAVDWAKPVWKHSLSGVDKILSVMKAAEESGEPAAKDTLAVVLTRSPVSTLVSWHKAPYQLTSCADRPWEEMGRPCVGDMKCTGENDEPCDVHFDRYSINFSSTMEAYNAVMRQNQEWKNRKVFKDVLYITYEDLVRYPETVMQKFGQAMGLSPPTVGEQTTITLMEGPAKDHGDATGRLLALEKLDKRSYMQVIPETLHKMVCTGFDRDLLQEFREATLEGHVSYMKDCPP